MDIKEILKSGILNTALIARDIWPANAEKSTTEEAIKKHNKFAAIKLNKKIKESEGQRLTDKDIEEISNYLKNSYKIILK